MSAFPRNRLRALATAVLLGLATLVLLPAGAAWNGERMLAAAQRLGPRAVDGARALQQQLQSAAALPELQRLVPVNDFYNARAAFADDAEAWGQADYWASPLETLEKGRADCEDYAIGKYFALLAAGVPVERLRLVYVRAQIGGPGGIVQAHMVLAYYGRPDAEPLILDNLVREVRPASQRPDLTPVFSFNGEGLWQGTQGASAGDPVARLSRWREVLAKARAEGFQ